MNPKAHSVCGMEISMFFRRKYKYVFLILPMIVIYRPFLFFGNQYMDETVGSIFLSNMFGGSYGTDKIKITLSVLSLFSSIIINILLSEYISGDLLKNGEYVLSRVENRKKWYLKKSLGLLGYCFLGVLLTIIIYASGAISKSNKSISRADIELILQAMIILLLFALVSSNLINIFALKLGVSIGFLCVYSVIVISEILTYMLQGNDDFVMLKILQRINIMSNVTIGWNFTNEYVWWAIAYFVILNIVVMFIGMCVVNRYEVGIRDIEQ